jgi:hypothetical protein
MLVEGSHVPMGQENHQFVSQSVSDVAVGKVDLDLSLDSFGFGDLLLYYITFTRRPKETGRALMTYLGLWS